MDASSDTNETQLLSVTQVSRTRGDGQKLSPIQKFFSRSQSLSETYKGHYFEALCLSISHQSKHDYRTTTARQPARQGDATNVEEKAVDGCKTVDTISPRRCNLTGCQESHDQGPDFRWRRQPHSPWNKNIGGCVTGCRNAECRWCRVGSFEFKSDVNEGACAPRRRRST